MVSYVTNQIKDERKESACEDDADIVVVEIGGIAGDSENILYLETVRQIRSELPEKETFLIQTTIVPYFGTTGEQRTKPTQHSDKELRETGLRPDMIIERSEEDLAEIVQEKISFFCEVEKKNFRSKSKDSLQTAHQV